MDTFSQTNEIVFPAVLGRCSTTYTVQMEVEYLLHGGKYVVRAGTVYSLKKNVSVYTETLPYHLSDGHWALLPPQQQHSPQFSLSLSLSLSLSPKGF